MSDRRRRMEMVSIDYGQGVYESGRWYDAENPYRPAPPRPDIDTTLTRPEGVRPK